MPANYVLLERVTLSASAASVVLDNIPQTGYTDLKIVSSTRTDRASQTADWVKISFNGSTSSFSLRELEGDGTTAASYTGTTGLAFFAPASTATANTFGNSEVYIPNYTSSNYKSYSADTVTENNAASANAAINAGLWSNTAAITSISFTPNLGTNFLQYSTFSLYGLAAVGTTPAIAPFASGGDAVTNDGTYWYHAFTSSGIFTPAKGLQADCLVVAGGGGGGAGIYYGGAGGGAGGLRYLTAQTLTKDSPLTVIVGAGGTGGIAGKGTNGNNSIFSSISTTGGGAGGGGSASAGQLSGASGGSGGGAAGNATYGGSSIGTGNAGAYSPAEGNNGALGNGDGFSFGSAGGGGGIGAAGTAGSGTTSNGTGGAGGVGVNTYSALLTATGLNNSSGYLAGGGTGGGAGGTTTFSAVNGGGGYGVSGNQNGGPAVANTGGGGGGGGASAGNSGGAGGSGIVIIRYPIA
jgi:hypothetical protein